MFKGALKIRRQVSKKLQRTNFYFDMVRSLYFRDHPIYNIPPNASKELKEFLENGAVVLPEFHSQKLIGPIRNKAIELVGKLTDDRVSEIPSEESIIYKNDGIYRLRDGGKYILDYNRLIGNPFIMDLVRQYSGTEASRVINYIDYKPDVGKHDYTSVPHMDSWESSVKVFTLLSDVTEDQAPFVYWKKSHLDWSWRRCLDFENFLGTEIGQAGNCPPSLLTCRSVEGGELEEVTVTGKAGTVIVVDTRVFHRASILNCGHRLQIVQKFPAPSPKKFMDVVFRN